MNDLNRNKLHKMNLTNEFRELFETTMEQKNHFKSLRDVAQKYAKKE